MVDPMVEFEILKISSEDTDYKISIDNIISSMEEELSSYLLDFKGITLEKLFKNFKYYESVELDYDKILEEVFKKITR